MPNRITDQDTQNLLIEQFKLEGLLPELSVADVVVPVVLVATLDGPNVVSQFEKWRSVLQQTPNIVEPADSTLFLLPWTAAVTKIAGTTQLVTNFGALLANGNVGVKLPGAAVAVAATDGMYRIRCEVHSTGGTSVSGSVNLVDQAAFGDPVALGTFRKRIGNFSSNAQVGGSFVIFDAIVKIRTLDIANAVNFACTGIAVAGNGGLTMSVVKLIDELSPVVIFS